MADRLDEARASTFDLAGVIGATRDLLPTFGHSEDMARPHIEENGEELSWVVVERGTEQARRTTRDMNELLYWVFEAVTFSMASDYELANRVEGQDSRIVLFKKQMELVGRLSGRWLARWRDEHAPMLREVGLA